MKVGDRVYYTGRVLHEAVEPAEVTDLANGTLTLRLSDGAERIEPSSSPHVFVDERVALATAAEILHRLSLRCFARAKVVQAQAEALAERVAQIHARLAQ